MGFGVRGVWGHLLGQNKHGLTKPVSSNRLIPRQVPAGCALITSGEEGRGVEEAMEGCRGQHIFSFDETDLSGNRR